MFVLYIFSFHRGCARQLDHRYGDFGRFDDQCRRICGRARVFTKTSSPFGGHSASGKEPTVSSSTPFVPESPRRRRPLRPSSAESVELFAVTKLD